MICYIISYHICSACSSAREGGPAKGCLQDMLFAIEADCPSGCWAALHKTTLWNADVKHMKKHGRRGCWAALHRTTLEIARILFTRLCLQSSQMS